MPQRGRGSRTASSSCPATSPPPTSPPPSTSSDSCSRPRPTSTTEPTRTGTPGSSATSSTGSTASRSRAPRSTAIPVCDALVELATTLLRTPDIRLYSAEAWAKYEGAADYDQDLHRDYLNHTVLAPSTAPAYRQLELFVFLSEVTVELGAPRMVPRTATTDGLPAKPNFFPRGNASDTEAGFVDVDRAS